MKKLWLKHPRAGLLTVIVFLAVIMGFAYRPLLIVYHLWQADQNIQSGAHLQAADHLAQAAVLDPSRTGIWERAGDEALVGNDPATAVGFFKQAASSGSLSPEGQVKLGDALKIGGDLPAAIQAWQAAPGNAQALSRLAEAHASLKDYTAEIADLKGLLQLVPGQAQTAYRLALLETAIDPASASAYLSQAALLDRSRTAAVQSIQTSLDAAALQSDPAYTYLLVGRALAALDEWDLAAEAFSRATLARTDYAEAWAYLGEARQHTTPANGEDRAGLAELEKSWNLDPGSISANTFLGFFWQRHARPDLALVYLKKAASLDPQNPALQTELGNATAALGDLPSAQDYYQQAIVLDPQNAVYWRILAEFSLTHDIQLREIALPAARQAVMLDPQNPIGLDLLGQTFFLLEDYANAVRTLQRALQASSTYPPAHLHLGQVYLMQGDLENGRQELDETIRMAPDSPSADQARRVLQRYFP